MTKRITAAVILFAFVVSACGSDSSGSGVVTLEDGGGESGGVASLDDSGDQASQDSGDPDLDMEEALLAFTECLREQGLEVEDPEFDNEGNFRLNMPMGEFMERMGREESRTAFNACSHLLMGITQRFGGFDPTDMEDQLYEYATCMRENGYDMADPDFSTEGGPGPGGEGGMRGPFSGVDFDDPDFQAANEVCQGLFGDGFGPGGFGRDRAGSDEGA